MTNRKRSLDQRLLSEARRAAPAFYICAGSTLVLSALVILQAILLSQIIHRAFRLGHDLEQTQHLVVVLAGVILLRAVFGYTGSRAAAQLAIGIKTGFRQRLVSRLMALGPAFVRAERTGDLALNATEGIDRLDGYYRDYLPGILAAVFLPLMILVVVFPLDLLTFAVLVITAPLIPLFMALIGKAAGILARRQFMEMRGLGAHFLDVMQGLTTLKLFNRSQRQAETIRRITGQFREATMRVLRVAFLSALTLEMLATLSVAVVAVEIGVRLLHGGIGFEQALFLLVIAPEFYLPLRALGAKFHNATESKAAAERLFEILDAPLPLVGSEAALPVPATIHIGFDHVTFAYEDGARPALKGVSFEIKPGQCVALVGSSGSGKTTVASLLLRFVRPDSGQITIDGSDLTRIPVEAWRQQLAWVSQSPYLFSASIADNIRFSRPDASMEQVVAAARMAGAHDFIMQFAECYDTPCGERGLRLSGGQAQRIALARAFLRDAPLLILDEPTSQLDPDSEAEIIRAIEKRVSGRTVLLIAHRLSTVIHSDWIVVMEQGQVVEQGTHADLLALDGAYARLLNSDGETADVS